MFVKRLGLAVAAVAALLAQPALAQKQYGPGVSDTEIKVGQTIAYSGPASAYGTLGKVEAAYFKWLNETKGGINGRKITFISRDDGYSPPKAVENVRSLVESDEVALIFGVLGTPLNMAIRPYLNKQSVPQLFVAAGTSALERPRPFPLEHGLATQFARRSEVLCQALARPQSEAKGGRCSTRTTISARICWQWPEGGSRRGG